MSVSSPFTDVGLITQESMNLTWPNARTWMRNEPRYKTQHTVVHQQHVLKQPTAQDLNKGYQI